MIVDMSIPETEQTIIRPIVIDMINQIKVMTKIDNNIKVLFPGDIGKMHQAGSTIDNDNREPLLATSKYILITVDEQYDQDNIYTSIVNKVEQPPIFVDRNLEVMIRGVYIKSNITINVIFKTPNKTETKRWIDEIRTKLSGPIMRDINLHTLHYSYSIPEPFLKLLKVIHRQREEIDGYGDNFNEYLKNHSTNKLTFVGDLGNKHRKSVVAETQFKIIGSFDFDELPEKPEKDDSSSWSIKFSYKFNFQKPIACNMHYPIMIHNQLLPPEYLTFYSSYYDPNNVPTQYTVSLAAMSHFDVQKITKEILNKYGYIKLPLFDDFILPPPCVFSGTKSIFIALCSLQLPNKKLLLNIKELDIIHINHTLLEFIITSEYKYIGSIYQSVFNVSLFNWMNLMGDKDLVCDKNLNIFSPIDLNLRNNYRVRFAVINDLNKLSLPALNRLKARPDILEILGLKLPYINKGDPNYVGNKTVEISSIIAFKKPQV